MNIIVAYKNNHLHAVSVLGKAFVLLYHLHLKFLYIHRHLTDDLGLDLQVAHGLVTITKSIFGTDSKYL